MIIAEAIAALEADCASVYDIPGYKVGDYDGPLDMSRAPNGGKYVCLTSGGLKKPGQPVATWFAFEDEAVSWWLSEARHLLSEHRAMPFLYWLHRPTLVSASFVNIAQHLAVQDDRLRDCLAVELKFVSSWLLLSAKDPAGKEISV